MPLVSKVLTTPLHDRVGFFDLSYPLGLGDVDWLTKTGSGFRFEWLTPWYSQTLGAQTALNYGIELRTFAAGSKAFWL